MSKAAAAKRAEQPALGEAALKEALAEFGAAAKAAPANGSTSGQAQAHPEAQPKTVAQVLGEIAWLMTQSPRHKQLALGDLEWLVMPAILLKQFRMFYNGEQPVGVALWALVDDIVAKRIDAGDVSLTAVERKSGTNRRIVDVVAPFGGVKRRCGDRCQVDSRDAFSAARFMAEGSKISCWYPHSGCVADGIDCDERARNLAAGCRSASISDP